MLEIRPNCENCGKPLAYNVEDAMICSFECTFCKDCVENILHNVCPNCGGGFAQRPVRPKVYLEKYPPAQEQIYKPIDLEAFQILLERFRFRKPEER
ncbi:MAG: DUF1272 domain-containing protein [Saprospiraceae bacterium]|nr:DUF1272 domain-containing protein [Saprospiraceae bacterium]